MATYNGFKSIEGKEFYERTLMKSLRENNVLMGLGKKAVLPKNHGDVMSWRKRKPVGVQVDESGNVRKLTEGITPASNKLEFVEHKTKINEYGDWIKLTKKLTNLSIDPILTEAMEGLGESAADTFDQAILESLYTATNIEYANQKTNSTIAAGDTITIADLHRIKAHFRRRNVKPYADGKYLMIITPEVEFDLKNNATVNASWIDISKYGANEKVEKGEIGSFMGFKFIVYNKLKTGAESGSTAILHNCIVLGKDAFGTIDLEGESGARPHVFYNEPGKVGTDPLKQRHSVAWKNEGWATRILEPSALAIFKVPSSLTEVSDLAETGTVISGTEGQYQTWAVQNSETPTGDQIPEVTD